MFLGWPNGRGLLNDSHPEQRPREVPRNFVKVQLFHFQLRLPRETRHVSRSVEGTIRNLEDPSLELQGGSRLFEGSHQNQLG